MYQGCQSCIRTDGVLSKLFQCETGVRQGDVLSPNLFNIYINDLPDIFKDDTDSPKLGEHFVNCLMYADDLVLLSLSVAGLQGKLDKLNNYCQQWDLSINIKKTKVMLMSVKNVPQPNVKLNIGGTTIDWVNSYKYLGIEVHSNGDMLAATKNLCVRGWKAAFKIKSTFKGLDVNPITRMKLFDVLVKPIICYGSEVWGSLNNLGTSKSMDQLWLRMSKLPVENFQVKFCKGVLNVHPKACNAAVMGELGRFPMFLYIVKSMLRYYRHICDVKTERPLLYAASGEDEILKGNKSWRGNLDKILSIFGVKLSTNQNLESHLMSTMKIKYMEYWKRSLGNKNDNLGKLYLYRKIKSNFNVEPYLKQIKKRKIRRSMTALRISAHSLEIETGRYASKKGDFVKREERYCSLCMEKDLKTPGDEIHAVLVCPSFHNERENVIGFIDNLYPNFKNLNDNDKLIFMLTCENECLQKVSKFINLILSMNRPNKIIKNSANVTRKRGRVKKAV